MTTRSTLRHWAATSASLSARAATEARGHGSAAHVASRAAMRSWHRWAVVKGTRATAARKQLYRADQKLSHVLLQATVAAMRMWVRTALASRARSLAASATARRLGARRQRLAVGRWSHAARAAIALRGSRVLQRAAALTFRVAARRALATWDASTADRLASRRCLERGARECDAGRYSAGWRPLRMRAEQWRADTALAARVARAVAVRESLHARSALRTWAQRRRAEMSTKAQLLSATARLLRLVPQLQLRRALRRWEALAMARRAAAKGAGGATNIGALTTFFGELRQLQAAMTEREARVAAREEHHKEAEARAARLEEQMVAQTMRHARDLAAADDEVRQGEKWRREHSERLAAAHAALEALQVAHVSQKAEAAQLAEEAAAALRKHEDEAAATLAARERLAAASLEQARAESGVALQALERTLAQRLDQTNAEYAQREAAAVERHAAELVQAVAAAEARHAEAVAAVEEHAARADERRHREATAMVAALAAGLREAEADADARQQSADATLETAARAQMDLRARKAEAESAARTAEAARMSAEAAATAASRRAETAIAAAAARQRETFVEAAATTRGAIEAAMVAEACAADASLRVALEAWREQQRRAAAAAAAAADAHRQAEADATASRAEMRATVDHLRGELDHLRAELDQERQRGWRLSDGATSIQREELRAALDRAEAAEAAAVHAHEEATSAQLELEAARRASSARVQTVRQREAEERRESAGLLLELRDELAAVHAEAAAAASPGSPAFAAASPSAAVRQVSEELRATRHALEQSRAHHAADASALDAQMRINARLHARLTLLSTSAGGDALAAPVPAPAPYMSAPPPTAAAASAAALPGPSMRSVPDTAPTGLAVPPRTVPAPRSATPARSMTPPTRSTLFSLGTIGSGLRLGGPPGGELGGAEIEGPSEVRARELAVPPPPRPSVAEAHVNASMEQPPASWSADAKAQLSAHAKSVAAAAAPPPASSSAASQRPAFIPKKEGRLPNGREKENGAAEMLRAAANAALLAPRGAHAEVNRPQHPGLRPRAVGRMYG